MLLFGIFGTVVGNQIGSWVGRFGGCLFVLRWGKFMPSSRQSAWGVPKRSSPGTVAVPSSWPGSSTRHSDALGKATVPAVGASGSRLGLRTRTRCAKIETGAEKEKQRWVFWGEGGSRSS